MVIGIDSADWHWIDQRIAAGGMPHLAALAERGVRADLASLQPRQKSPVIWTSIATGKVPSKHGVGGFRGSRGAPARSAARSAAAWWEILGARDLSQAVVGWWVTYPATPVNGVMVSDYVQYAPRRDQPIEGAVHPPGAWDTLAPLAVAPEQVTLDDLARFVDPDLARAHGTDAERLLEKLRWIYAGDETYRAVARHLYAEGHPDVLTVYFRGLDAVSHAYWAYYEPEKNSLSKRPWEVELLGRVVPRYHDYVDEVVGEIVGYVDPRSRVLVVSDHGFTGHGDGQRLALGVEMHRDTGIFVLAGPDVPAGATLSSPSVLDVAPTVLALAGAPPATDFDGTVAGPVLTPRLERWVESQETPPTYDTLVTASEEPPSAPDADAEAIRRLKALGYVE